MGSAAGILYAQSFASNGLPSGTELDDQGPVVHPKLWPMSKSPIGLNLKIERRIDLLRYPLDRSQTGGGMSHGVRYLESILIDQTYDRCESWISALRVAA